MPEKSFLAATTPRPMANARNPLRILNVNFFIFHTAPKTFSLSLTNFLRPAHQMFNVDSHS